ncbi:hypothetical protein FQA39_LY04242 [Lamprigera yunnana]|nr:hypothetical protein FQA39_LY04242 [Lamprigera yunnana]
MGSNPKKYIYNYLKKISIRTLKDHLFLILDIFLKKDKTTQIMSGVEEMYSERDRLLQDVSGMCQKAEVNPVIKKRKMSKEKQISELGKQSRDSCSRQLLPKNIENLSAASTPTLDHNYWPKKSRTNKSDALRRTALDYLQNKEAKEQMVKIKQLRLGARKA